MSESCKCCIGRLLLAGDSNETSPEDCRELQKVRHRWAATAGHTWDRDLHLRASLCSSATLSCGCLLTMPPILEGPLLLSQIEALYCGDTPALWLACVCLWCWVVWCCGVPDHSTLIVSRERLAGIKAAGSELCQQTGRTLCSLVR